MLDTTKDNTRKLHSLSGLLARDESSLREDREDAGRMQDVPMLMLQRAFAFGGTTLKAMIVVADHDAECGVCMPTLCRPFYELAVRVLWASREPDGWHRLQAHYANERKKWAQRAVNLPAYAGNAQSVFDSAKRVLGRRDAKGKCYQPAPNMWRTLQEVEQHDIGRGIKMEKGFASSEYNSVWQNMCDTAHGHVVQIARSPQSHACIAVGGATLASFALLRAKAVFTIPAEEVLKETVEAMLLKFSGILKG